MNDLAKEFIGQSIHRMEMNTPKIIKCLDQLTEQQIWMRPNEASNSIGNIMLHLCGNIRQYVISALGEQTDIRERDKEFAAQGGLTKAELISKLDSTVQHAVKVIRNASEHQLMKIFSVQGFTYSGVGIVVHVTEHYSYHAGQIIFWTKLLTGQDLGFYANVDLNKRNNS